MSAVLARAIAQTVHKKQDVDVWLDQVDYDGLNSGSYQPTSFALKFVNFIKLVNGGQGETHPSPVMHMSMLDKLTTKATRLANLVFRGSGKTTLFIEYLFLYIAVFGEIEGFGDITGMIYVSDSMENGVKSARKNIEFRYNNSEFLQYWLPKASFTDNYLEMQNRDGHMLGMKMFGAKTGLRGTKIFGKRPVLAVLDDLVSDDDSKSKVAMIAIKDTVYKGVDYALDPTRRKIILNGTPFNKNDIVYEAIESGGWEVNVWPICERFPCTPEEFRGAWEERFSYAFVKEQYDLAVSTGQLASFMQELMLRITNPEDRVIPPESIRWYNRDNLIKNKSRFNFFITSDFATTENQAADYTVIAVWALNNNGDWFWVDGIRHQKTMDKTLDELFRLVAQYRPMSVGIEVNGQQAGFIPWLQEQQMNRNVWFTFASANNSKNPGVRRDSNKLSNFNKMVPSFNMGKVYFPEEYRTSAIVAAFVDELANVTPMGFKTKNDDCLDNISMLPVMGAWRPSEEAPVVEKDGKWDFEDTEVETSGMAGYVV